MSESKVNETELLDAKRTIPCTIYQEGTYKISCKILADDNGVEYDTHECSQRCWCHGKTLCDFDPAGHGHSRTLSRLGIPNIGEPYGLGTEKFSMRHIYPLLIAAKITKPVFTNLGFFEIDDPYYENRKTCKATPTCENEQTSWQLAVKILIYDGKTVYTPMEYALLDNSSTWLDRCIPLTNIWSISVLAVHPAWHAHRRLLQVELDKAELKKLFFVSPCMYEKQIIFGCVIIMLLIIAYNYGFSDSCCNGGPCTDHMSNLQQFYAISE